MDIRTAEMLGEEWIKAIVDKDFDQLATISHPDVRSSLMVPSRIYQLENAIDLSKKVEDWFGEYDTIEKMQARVAMVGEKLGIFYRFRCVENGEASLIEQQVFCSLGEGLIERLWLVCSGFQSTEPPVGAFLPGEMKGSSSYSSSTMQAVPQANALLEFKADESHGSTCALLTPYIKQKLTGLSSGQVLEVHVDDITAREDIEAWSRLSGNLLLKMDQIDGRGLVFFILKK